MPTRKQKLRVRRDSSLVSIDAGRPASTPTRKASAAFASGSTICRQPLFANETQAIQGHMKHRNTAADMNVNATPERGRREREVDSQHNTTREKRRQQRAM